MKKPNKIDVIMHLIIDISCVITLIALWIGSYKMAEEIKYVILFTIIICIHLTIDFLLLIFTLKGRKDNDK